MLMFLTGSSADDQADHGLHRAAKRSPGGQAQQVLLEYKPDLLHDLGGGGRHQQRPALAELEAEVPGAAGLLRVRL